jgi:two-component system sensor histidine kinase YesM
MKSESKKWISSIFARLLLTFLAIMLPIFLLSLRMYSWGTNTLRQRIFDSMNAQVSFSISNLESEIGRIQISLYNCASDADLQLLALSAQDVSDFDKSQAVSRLYQHLYQIKLSSRYIEDVSAYIPQYGGIVSSNSYYATFNSEEFNKYNSMLPDTGKYFIKVNGGKYLVLKAKLKMPDTNTPAFILVVKLSESEMKDTLAELETNGTSMLLINYDNQYTSLKNSEAAITNSIQSLVIDNFKIKTSNIIDYKEEKNKYSVIYQSSKSLNIAVVSFTEDYKVFKPLEKYKAWFIIFTFSSILIIILYAFSTHKFINEPLGELVGAFKKVEKGDLSIAIEHKQNDEFKYLYYRFNAMVQNLNTLIDQAYKQKLLAQRATLKQLQSQIDPHFLYNSFFILHRLIKKNDNDNAQVFSKELGNYFKFVTRSAADEVTLQEEVEHAKTYCNIQSMRFSRRISVQFDELPEEYKNITVPRLILQPLIENAFEHGLKDKVSNGLLDISFEIGNGVLSINIEDNGDNLTAEQIENMKRSLLEMDEYVENTALLNIHKRIVLSFGEENGLTIARGRSGGLKITVNIKFNEVV